MLRHRWLVLLLCLSLTGFFIYQTVTRLEVDTTAEAFLGDDHAATRALDRLQDSFGNDSIIQVLVEGDVFSQPFLRRLQRMHGELELIDVELDHPLEVGKGKGADTDAESTAATDTDTDADFADFGDDFGDDAAQAWGDEGGGSVIDEVVSLINVRQTEWRDGGVWVGGLLDTWPSASQLPALARKVLADRTLVGQVVGREGRHAVAIVRAVRMRESDRNKVYDAVVEIARRCDDDGFRVRVGGTAAVDVSRGLMVFRVAWLDASAYAPFAEYVRRGVREFIGTRADVTLTGTVFTQFSVARSLLSDLLRSFAVALLVITLVMIGVLRDIKLGLIAMAPNLARALSMVYPSGGRGDERDS